MRMKFPKQHRKNYILILERNDMNWYKIAIGKEQIVYIFSLDSFIGNIDGIFSSEMNVISIRDPNPGKNAEKYAIIDSRGFKNIYTVTFGDIQTEKDKIHYPDSFPKKEDVHSILDWAKKKWNINHKPFAIHCTGGVSRSSSIAILISQMIQGSYLDVYDPQYHSPNKAILGYGAEKIGSNHIVDEIEKIEEKYDERERDIPFSF